MEDTPTIERLFAKTEELLSAGNDLLSAVPLLREFAAGTTVQPVLEQHVPQELAFRRQMICAGDFCEIYVIAWKTGHIVPLHDHPDGGCLMLVLNGRLSETTFDTAARETICVRQTSAGDVSHQRGAVILHSLVALEDSTTLHLYAPPGYSPNFWEG
ncbi:MAG: cysteine dioxygenase [Sulfobacillus sp.]